MLVPTSFQIFDSMSSSSGNILYYRILLEIIWWVFTCLIAALILLPVYYGTLGYPFYFLNTLYIFVLITLARYIFQLKHVFFAQWQYVKVGLIFLSPILIFYLVQELNFFQTFLDEQGLEAIVGAGDYQVQQGIMRYIYSEMMLFGIGSIISAVIFPIRLLVSIWRVHNKAGI